MTQSKQADVVVSSPLQKHLLSQPLHAPKIALALGLLSCCLLLLGHITWVQAEDSDTPLEQVTLQLKWKHQFQFAGYYAAQRQGLYHDAGLEVRIVEAEEGTNPIAAVVDGQAEYGVGTSELLLWRSQGKAVVVLGVIFQHSPLVLTSLQDSGVDSLHDLRDKRIVIEENSAELLAYLQDEGITPDQLQILSHSFSPDMLIEGVVDAMSAYSTDEPFLLSEAGLAYDVFSPRSAGIDFYGDVLFTTEEQIKNHPQQVQAFLDASMAGWRYAFNHEDELIDYIYTQLTQRHSREHLKFEAEKMRKLILPDLIAPGYMYDGRWRHIAETYMRVGLIPTSFTVTDMLYQRDTSADLRPLSVGLVAALVIMFGISLVALRFYRLIKLLNLEIQERENAQVQLRESEARYRSLVEAAPFAVVITRLTDNTLRYLNPRAEEQLKLERASAYGKNAVSFYENPEDRAHFMQLIDEQGQVQDFEVCLHDMAGHQFWAAISALKMIYEGEPAIFVTFKDMTERRWMEAKRRESEALYRSILHASPDDVTITDLQGNITMVSPQGLKMLGYGAEADVVGRPLDYWAIAEDQPLVRKFIAAVQQGANAGIEQYRVAHKSGLYFDVEIKGEVIYNSAGLPHALVFIIRDITERKEAEAQAFALAIEQERVKLITHFIQDAAHEFRTPLSVISSSMYLLLKHTDDQKRQHYTQNIDEQISRITRLVDMLSTMALLDSGAPMIFTPTDLSTLVQQVFVSTQSESTSGKLQFDLETTEAAPSAKVDREQFSIALRQLVDNAIRYTPVGGKISLHLIARDAEAIIEVRDTGIGIEPALLPHIFERFWRRDEAHNTPGFGLGLPLAQKIITAHDGRIEVESVPGAGSVFRIILPLYVAVSVFI